MTSDNASDIGIDVTQFSGMYLAVWFSGEHDLAIFGLRHGEDPVTALKPLISKDPSKAVVKTVDDGWMWETVTAISEDAQTSGRARLITAAERATFLGRD